MSIHACAPKCVPAWVAWVAWVPLMACAADSGPAPRPLVDTGGAPDTLLSATRADAAQRAGVVPGVVVLRSAEAVTWPNGAIGCAQPDRVYTQALVPGWRVVWRAAERDWQYHAGRAGNWVWCPAERAQAPLREGGSR